MFDAHCDTLLKALKGGSLHSNTFDVSFEGLASYGSTVQMFALFNNGDFTTKDILSGISFLISESENSSLAKFCVTAEDIDSNETPVSVLASLEGVGNTPGLSPDDINSFYDMGVRVVGICWNNDNPFCGGCNDNKLGLTDEGVKIVSRIKKLGMVADVSHISDVGFYDLLKTDGLNIMATHSNSRTICPHNRNLTDEQFKYIIERNGVVGINLYPLFLNNTGFACVHDVIRHIEHFCSLGGECNIGLGADFDGMDIKMRDINSCRKMNVLINELAKMNYSEHLIRSVYCENLMNFYRKMNFKI